MSPSRSVAKKTPRRQTKRPPRALEKKRSTFEVKVTTRSGQVSSESKITILDGWDSVQAEGYGRLSADLPPGLFPVRVERGGFVFAQEVCPAVGTKEFV